MKGAHVGGCHRLKEFLPLVHLYYYHVYAVDNIAQKESKHHVKPCANVQGTAKAVAHSEGGKHGGVYGGADKVHLTALGVGSLNVVDSHREKREARLINHYVDNST